MKSKLPWIKSLFLIIVCVLMLSKTGFGQQSDDRNLFSDAEYYFLFQDFNEALPLYLRLLESDPENANYNYKVGICYLNISGFKTKSIPFLEKAVNNINLKYREGSFNENASPLDALFQLGNAYRIANRIDDAVEIYTQYADRIDPKDIYSYDFVQQQIDASKRAKLLLSQPLQLRRYDLNLFEGTSKQVFSPIISANGQFLVVTVQEKFYDAIYISHKEGDTWGAPVNITLDLAVEGEIYATSISADGSQLFFFKNDRGVGNIYSSKNVNGKWGKAFKLGPNINTRYWETHASLSADGKLLFFTSNRRGGFGGIDIYVSSLLPNGEWGPAVNLGPTINTQFNEEAPYLMPDGQSLVFASQGHMGMGGYDIFCAKRIDETSWAQPTNLGYPISSTDDDIFYFPLTENSGLLSIANSQLPGVSMPQLVQIDRFTERTHVPIVGSIVVSDNEEVEPALFNLTLVDLKTTEIVGSVKPTGIKGDFEIRAFPGIFHLIAQGKGYFPDTILISISTNYTFANYSVSINMIPEAVGKGEAISIRSIQFAFDSYKLSREAQFEMERIIAFMNKYPSVIIEVTGHTDSRGSVQYNRKLSLLRAEAVINYIKSKGIARERMVARAAGSLENVASNLNTDGTDNPEGRAFNRRATISLINSNEAVKILDELQVPENLKPRIQDFAILLVPIGQTAKESDLVSLKKAKGVSFNVLKTQQNSKVYTVGWFSHKSDAIELLNFCIENGFPNATLMGVDDLQTINSPQSIRSSSRSGSVSDSNYTIQVAASPSPINFSNFPLKLETIKLKNGTLIYHFGKYNQISDAEKDLERIMGMGYKNAFVVNIKRFSE